MLFSISYVLLILIALLQSKPVIPLHHQHGWLVAFIGGIGIYLLFAIGKAFLILTNLADENMRRLPWDVVAELRSTGEAS